MTHRCFRLFCILLIAAQQSMAGPDANPTTSAKTFTFRIPAEPETLDWNRAHTPLETNIIINLMEGLIGLDDSLKIVPATAQSWTTSEDGRTYTFKIKPGIKWSDGVTLRAQDFVYSWKRLLSPMTAASYAYILFDIEGAEWYYKGVIKDFNAVGIKALDDVTLQVKLSRSIAHWIYIPTFWVTFPLRQDIVEKFGDSWEKPGRMATIGPFMLSSRDIDSRIILKANPNYYGTRGNVDQVIAQVIRDDAAALSLYEAGKIDFLSDLSSRELKHLEDRRDLKTFPYLKTGYIGFSIKKYPASNRRVRRAIAMAIDKRKISEILNGGQTPATSLVPPKLLGYSKEIGLAFNPLQAKSELRGAGTNSTLPIRLDLLIPNWDKQVLLAQFIQAELKTNLGINVEIQGFDNKSFRTHLDLKTYPVFEGSWAADFPDPDNFLSVFMSTSGNNRTGFAEEKKFDERVLEARNIMNASAREKIYFEMQKFLIEDEAIIIPLYYEPNRALIRSRVSGLELNPLNYLLLKKVSL